MRATPLRALERGGIEQHYVRDHLGAPAETSETLVVKGAVEHRLALGDDDLRQLPARDERIVLECAGHRRDEHRPSADGVAWEVGAVGEAVWRGTPLRDLLQRARPLLCAEEVVLHGADGFARSLPLSVAMSADPLIAWLVDGEAIPEEHGAPIRALAPGRYATDSVKWLTKIEVISEPFAGRWQADEYRWVGPGDREPGRALDLLPVHALITRPGPDNPLERGPTIVRGVAWSDGAPIRKVELRIDDGPWFEADVTPAPSRFALAHWDALWHAEPGWHKVDARATDARGRARPLEPPPNAHGYANNAVHSVAVEVDP